MNKTLLISLTLMLVACQTPYQKAGLRGGYTDQPLGSDRYLVNYQGNGATSYATVQSLAVRRAEEVCKENGFPLWKVEEIQGGNTQHQMGGGQTNCTAHGTYTRTINCNTSQPTTFNKASVDLIVQCKRDVSSTQK